MASSKGFEPSTVRLEGACSIQLSYEDISTLNNNIKRITSVQGKNYLSIFSTEMFFPSIVIKA